MKQVLTILLSILLIFSLSACGGRNSSKNVENEPSQDNAPLTREDSAPLTREDNEISSDNADNTEGTSTGDIDVEEIVKGANRNSLTPEQIAALEADAAANGYELQWQPDGSLVIVEEGHAMSLNGDWPDNEYTKGVPAPGLEIMMSTDDGSSFTAVFGSVTIDQVKAYAEELKNAGFTEDAETTDQEASGMTIYMYSAHHADGRFVELMFTGAQNALMISK